MAARWASKILKTINADFSHHQCIHSACVCSSSSFTAIRNETFLLRQQWDMKTQLKQTAKAKCSKIRCADLCDLHLSYFSVQFNRTQLHSQSPTIFSSFLNCFQFYRDHSLSKNLLWSTLFCLRQSQVFQPPHHCHWDYKAKGWLVCVCVHMWLAKGSIHAMSGQARCCGVTVDLFSSWLLLLEVCRAHKSQRLILLTHSKKGGLWLQCMLQPNSNNFQSLLSSILPPPPCPLLIFGR